MPFLLLKKRQAEIVLELDALNKEAEGPDYYFGNHHPVPDWLIEKRMKAFEQMKQLNGKERYLYSFNEERLKNPEKHAEDIRC